MPTLPPPHQPIADRLHYPFSCQRPYGTALNVRFSPKRTFVPGRLNVRFAPKAVIRRRSEIGQPLGTKRAGQVNTAKDQLFPRCAPPNDFCTLTPYQATCGGIKKR
jgi:hypothetical protein